MGLVRLIWSELDGFFEYDTPKFVHVRSRWIGVCSRLLQLLVVCYVIGYDLVLEKGYQHMDVGVSGVTTKVKGLVYTNATTAPPGLGGLLLDSADYSVPPQMNGAFFVTTNMIVTKSQQRGRCREDATVTEAACRSDADCRPGRVVLTGNGVGTGRCERAAEAGGGGAGAAAAAAADSAGACEVNAWCPVENDTLPQAAALLRDSRDFTVLIKNYVYFPYYDKRHSNIPENADAAYLRTCRYHAVRNPRCPTFSLGDIVGYIEGESYDRLALRGGVVSIRISWDCDLDYDIRHCRPTYAFARLDGDAAAGAAAEAAAEDAGATAAQGYNFRYAHKYVENGTEKRTLVKAFGILFIVSVASRARAFHVVPLLMRIGSGLGLLGLSAIVCDFLLLYVSRRRQAIKRKKFDGVEASVSHAGVNVTSPCE